MKKIALIDPSVGTRNVGDDIIHKAVVAQITKIFPDAFFFRVSSHEYMGPHSRKLLSDSDLIFVGGSNLLKSKMEWNTQWKLTVWDFFALRGAILLGCGWRHYDREPTYYTRNLYRRTLHRQYIHSVRDGFTAGQLNKGGIKNVLNTACVTMWDLTPEHCANIPASPAEDVVVTVTAYHPDPVNDRALLDLAFSNYKHVFLFVQQPDDLDYAQGLAGGRLKMIPPTLDSYDQLLNENVDYIGTRLHGGIRALQKKRRAMIIAIDNRASEIAKDTGLPVVTRDDHEGIRNWMTCPRATALSLPSETIERWRAQFAN